MRRSQSLSRWLAPSALLAAFWVAASISDFFLDRPFVYTKSTEWSGHLVHSVARFPNAFELARYTLAVVFLVPALLLAARALADKLPDPLPWLMTRLGTTPTRAALGLAGIAALASFIVGFGVVGGTALLDDERSYAFQAGLLADGSLKLPTPPAAFRHPMILLEPAWMSKYPPGLPLLLMPGVLLGQPQLMVALCAAVLVLASYLLAREAFGERQALLTASLLSASPFVWCTAGTLMAFAPAAAFLTLALAMVARAERRDSFLDYVWAGAALSFAGLMRPYDAVLFGVPVACWLALAMVRQRRFRSSGVVVGGIPAVALLLWYNANTTGSALRMAYWLARDFSLGFTRSLPGFAYEHAPVQTIGNLAAALIRLDTWMLAWPGSLLLVLAGFCMGERSRWDRRLCVLVFTHALGYSLLASSGTWDVGPTYYFVVAPLLVMIAARGVRALRNACPAESRSRRFFGFVPIVGVVISACSLAPLHLVRLGALTDQIEAPWRAIVESDAGDAVIALPSHIELGAAGYSLGYPYEIRTPSGIAHLVRPQSESELRDARRFLGSHLPAYTLTLDRSLLRSAGERRYELQRLTDLE